MESSSLVVFSVCFVSGLFCLSFPVHSSQMFVQSSLYVSRAPPRLNNPHCLPSVTIPWHIGPNWKQRSSR